MRVKILKRLWSSRRRQHYLQLGPGSRTFLLLLSCESDRRCHADEPDAHRPLSRAGSEQHMGPEAYLGPGAVPFVGAIFNVFY
jgi:hypothetical protein